MKKLVTKPRDEIAFDQVDHKSQIIAGITSLGDVVLLMNQGYRSDKFKAQVITPRDLQSGNSYTGRCGDPVSIIDIDSIGWFVFDSSKEFFEWAAKQ